MELPLVQSQYNTKPAQGRVSQIEVAKPLPERPNQTMGLASKLLSVFAGIGRDVGAMNARNKQQTVNTNWNPVNETLTFGINDFPQDLSKLDESIKVLENKFLEQINNFDISDDEKQEIRNRAYTKLYDETAVMMRKGDDIARSQNMDILQFDLLEAAKNSNPERIAKLLANASKWLSEGEITALGKFYTEKYQYYDVYNDISELSYSAAINMLSEKDENGEFVNFKFLNAEEKDEMRQSLATRASREQEVKVIESNKQAESFFNSLTQGSSYDELSTSGDFTALSTKQMMDISTSYINWKRSNNDYVRNANERISNDYFQDLLNTRNVTSISGLDKAIEDNPGMGNILDPDDRARMIRQLTPTGEDSKAAAYARSQAFLAGLVSEYIGGTPDQIIKNKALQLIQERVGDFPKMRWDEYETLNKILSETGAVDTTKEAYNYIEKSDILDGDPDLIIEAKNIYFKMWQDQANAFAGDLLDSNTIKKFTDNAIETVLDNKTSKQFEQSASSRAGFNQGYFNSLWRSNVEKLTDKANDGDLVAWYYKDPEGVKAYQQKLNEEFQNLRGEVPNVIRYQDNVIPVYNIDNTEWIWEVIGGKHVLSSLSEAEKRHSYLKDRIPVGTYNPLDQTTKLASGFYNLKTDTVRVNTVGSDNGIVNVFKPTRNGEIIDSEFTYLEYPSAYGGSRIMVYNGPIDDETAIAEAIKVIDSPFNEEEFRNNEIIKELENNSGFFYEEPTAKEISDQLIMEMKRKYNLP